MNQGLSLLGGIGIGAGLMYLLDPIAGRRRRSLLRDQVVGAAHCAEDSMGKAWRDLRHRAQGFAAEASTSLWDEPASDRVLAERVRAKMGRYVSHPGAIKVAAHDGRVTLSGLILSDEVEDLISCVRSVRGVCDVENRLEAHDQAEGIAALQGGRKPVGEPFELMQANWSPSTRLLVGAAGSGLVAVGLTQRFPVSCVLGTLGLGLCARASISQDTARFLGSAGRGELRDQGGRGQAAGTPEPQARQFTGRRREIPVM